MNKLGVNGTTEVVPSKLLDDFRSFSADCQCRVSKHAHKKSGAEVVVAVRPSAAKAASFKRSIRHG